MFVRGALDRLERRHSQQAPILPPHWQLTVLRPRVRPLTVLLQLLTALLREQLKAQGQLPLELPVLTLAERSLRGPKTQ